MTLDTTESCTTCSLPGQLATCNCAPQATVPKSTVLVERKFSPEATRLAVQQATNATKGGLRRNIRGGVMLGIACITSPCCTPLIVPAVLAILAGTPLALWITQHANWIYGALTLVSFSSFVLGLRWLWQKLSPVRMLTEE